MRQSRTFADAFSSGKNKTYGFVSRRPAVRCVSLEAIRLTVTYNLQCCLYGQAGSAGYAVRHNSVSRNLFYWRPLKTHGVWHSAQMMSDFRQKSADILCVFQGFLTTKTALFGCYDECRDVFRGCRQFLSAFFALIIRLFR